MIDRKSNRGRRRRPVSDYIAIVRPPGDPTAIRVFARDELDEAQRYASAHDTQVEDLPE
ncbi:hypothetical protein ACFOJ6_25515 [Gordonia humi]|uniref:hypothetical protein n=1 Tax=Gordonia humi TaxID=686429 RepID=UPI00361173F9